MPSRVETNYLQIWHDPEARHEYIVGADVAQGLAHGDYSVAYVFCRQCQRYEAEWRGHCDADIFSVILHDLARFYNDALVIPEDNGPGQTVISRMREVYWNLYLRKVPDAMRGILHDQYGFQTTWRSKPLLIDALKMHLRNTKHPVPLDLLDELTTYIYDERGNMNGQDGTFDDRVIAAALCIRADLDMPPPADLPVAAVSKTAKSADWVWLELRRFKREIDEKKAQLAELERVEEAAQIPEEEPDMVYP